MKALSKMAIGQTRAAIRSGGVRRQALGRGPVGGERRLKKPLFPALRPRWRQAGGALQWLAMKASCTGICATIWPTTVFTLSSMAATAACGVLSTIAW